MFACSDSAGRWMFPNHSFTIIKNGINTRKFSFDPTARADVRKELHITESLVLGHVGRFEHVKNHTFLIDVFSELKAKVSDAVLLLVGTGSFEPQIREKVQRLGLLDSVLFLGVRSDVHRILQAVDVFVMPSLYEGLPVVTVEAQTSGVSCVFSDTISTECKMTDNVTFLSLNESPSTWASQILAGALRERTNCQVQITNNGYDIQSTADYLQAFYTNMW
jgi:glycosyltransferase involved in cell wall biosynthesis